MNLLKTIRMFVTKGFVGAQEFQSGEDDMAFVTAADAETISIANDVITLPDETPAKQLMSAHTDSRSIQVYDRINND